MEVLISITSIKICPLKQRDLICQRKEAPDSSVAQVWNQTHLVSFLALGCFII